jgi:hypothetical protein
MTTKTSWYIGRLHSGSLEAFTSRTVPTETTHGTRYTYAIGPFRTRRAAQWAERYGSGNPHFRHVDDAERLAAIS